MTRVKKCSPAQARARAAVAAGYLDAAKAIRDEQGRVADQVATGNAVLAAVAAADAICGWLLGEYSRAENHGEAERLLARCARRPHDEDWTSGLVRAFAQAIESKDTAHYGFAGISHDSGVRAIRAAERLVAAALDVTGR